MTVPDQRTTTGQGTSVALDDSVAVIATEVRLLKEDLGRRMDEQRDELRNMRSDVATNYVHHQTYQAEYGRITDRIANVEADVIELRTSLATQFVDVHGHIDKRFDEIAAARHWSWGLIVAMAASLLTSVAAIAAAFIIQH